jgi:hypothetical protein
LHPPTPPNNPDFALGWAPPPPARAREAGDA